MAQIINSIILAAYLFSLYFIGQAIVRTWFGRLPALAGMAGAFLLGTGVGIPATYIVSCLFAKTGSPIEWGVGIIIALAVIIGFLLRHNNRGTIRGNLTVSDLLLVVFSFVFSTWLMTKTFHGGSDGQLFVGSNNVFDFGHALGIIRSFSSGVRFPLSSPFQSGLPFLYHFFFYFWVAIWEYFGIPIVWAMNIPSILSFAAFLIVIYWVLQMFVKQGRLAGWIAVLLTITNSSLTFWKVVGKMDLRRLPAYPFAGPFDGSTISLFVTLNNFVNQRHLAFATALALFLYAAGSRRTGKFLVGVLTGMLVLWNIPIYLMTMAIHTGLMAWRRQWRQLALYIIGAVIVGGLWLLPYINSVPNAFVLLNALLRGVSASTVPPAWNIAGYLWQNLGLLLPVAVLGFVALGKRVRQFFIPAAAGFIVVCVLAAVAKRGFDQKLFSFFIIGVNILAATGFVWLWAKRNMLVKVLTLILFGVLTISGFVDLMPIKNEFAYPLIGGDTAPVITWIRNSTPKDAVFVSYSDIIDPVVLAGRRNFSGFFGNIGGADRAAIVSGVYQGDSQLAKTNNISYILVPRWKKSDFPYAVDVASLTKQYARAYEDDKFLILKTDTNSSLPAITIINSIRGPGLGHESDDLFASLQVQWQVTKEAGVNATWLFQYGALENAGMTEFAKREMTDQEFGLLFEIDRNFAEKAGVQFRGQGAWFASDGLFLNSYDSGERKKLIDTAFFGFKNIFGYYPKTVGAWWIGGDSLSYMQEKYGITAAMRAADQFNLDFYSLWGTPWNIPYLPSKVNEGMPAASFDTSAKVVVLQWAIRDPLKGYADPLYSLQDYTAKGYTAEYVDYLASIFLQKPFGNFVIGLENGGTIETFGKFYKTMLSKAKEIQALGKGEIVLARDYSEHFLAQKKVFAGRTHFLSTDYESQNQSFWYISENYRATIFKTNDAVSLVDLRNYADKTKEDFDVLPNSQNHLRIQEPAIIDSARFPDSKIFIKTTGEPLTIKEKDKTVELYAGTAKIASFTPTGCTIGQRTYSFTRAKPRISPLHIILALTILYLGVNYSYRRNFLLLIPLLLAFPFLGNNSTFLFDKKETLVLAVISLFQFPVLVTVYISKILPLLLLIFLPKKHVLYWVYYALVVLLYLHVPYFPLDKTTYMFVFTSFAAVGVLLYITAFFIYRRTKSKKRLVLCCIIPLIILLSLAMSVVISRSRYALTSYEINALQKMKDQKKSVLYVEEVDYSVRPIYKAVRPLLYANNGLAQLIIGKKWETVMRPENNVLNISDYDNKLIVVPRYLGSDLSEYEMTTLHLKKIFDNAQIAVFEKNK